MYLLWEWFSATCNKAWSMQWTEIKYSTGRVCYFNAVNWNSILYQGFWIYLYFRIRHSFAHLRPLILSADWSISLLQSWTCLSLLTVAEFVKLTQSSVVEAQRQPADLYKVQLCNQQFFVVSTAIYVVKVYECHPLDSTGRVLFNDCWNV